MLDARLPDTVSVDTLQRELDDALDQQRRADCFARIQGDAVQLALDLVVRDTDIDSFFRVFIKTLVDECESRACGVWLLDAEGVRVEPWIAYVDGEFHTRDGEDWDRLTLPRREMAAHLQAFGPGWSGTVEHDAADDRLPQAVRDFNRSAGIDLVQVAPLSLPTRNLGWIALASDASTDCERQWRSAVLEATARQATLALYQDRLAEQSRVEVRRQAALEERNRIARDIHDTLTQGFAAILMQLQAAQRAVPDLPAPVASAMEVAVDLARTHMIEARRSVGALRPQPAGEESLPAALTRMTTLARRTSDVPIELTVDDLPPLGGLERDVIGIAQEALTNAVKHARARRITIRASAVREIGFRLSVADDGRGIAREHRSRGFGMTSMQERAERIGASLTIVTAPRAGTEVVLAWEPPSFSIPVSAYAAR